MMKKDENLSRMRNQYVPQGIFNAVPAFIKEARGAIMVDVNGRELIDFAGGIGTLNVGHCHPKVVRAIKDQAEKYIHTCFSVAMYEPYVKLAERLCGITPGSFPKMAMFVNSGAEAVENAVKIARYFTKRPAIVTFENSFHGRTLLTMSLTSRVRPYKFGFGPFAPEIYRISYGNADYLKEFFINHVPAEAVAAIIAEPVQGEGGFRTPPSEFFPKLVKICREKRIVFIADEIQSGMGRTGRMFAIEHWNVEPDLITIAKSLAAGLPLSAVVGRKKIMATLPVGSIGGTFGGNPVACKAALAVLDIFEEENLLQKAQILGKKLRERFNKWQKNFEMIGNIHGLGPMLAFELVRDQKTKDPASEEAKKLVNICYEKGLVVLTSGNFGNIIRMLMPLVITDNQLDKGLDILEESLQEISQ